MASMHRCACADETSNAVDLGLLDPILERYAHESGALIPVLQHAQEVYGYLPRSVLSAIATARRVPFSEVYGVATFYTQFHLEPRGKTIVRICHGTACHVAGATEVTRAVTDELMTKVGETSEDMRFTVEAVACVGCCGLAPVVVVGTDTHGQLDPNSARKLGKQIYRGAPK
jgi:NADH:ubiquinone oxidoreductase subunit E